MHDRWDPTRFLPPVVWVVFIIINIVCFFVFLFYSSVEMMVWHIFMLLFCYIGFELSKKNCGS